VRFVLPLTLVLVACGAPRTTPCGIQVGGDRVDSSAVSSLTQADLDSAVRRALDGATYTTDPRLADGAENCRAMEGFTVFTRSTPTFTDEAEEDFGVTRCWASEVVVGTPESGSWELSGLVHELFHVMQRCSTPMPIDVGRDSHHSNWDRDRIIFGIGKGEDRSN
jgi:hypothetical protein